MRWLGFEDADRTWEPLAFIYGQLPKMAAEYIEGVADADERLLPALRRLQGEI